MAMDDQMLLRRYCADGDQEAFGELVRRHLGLVYSAALRQVADPGLAEDVAQMVFTRLAQRASRLPSDLVLAGWLHADTRLTALQLLRSDQRRRVREAEASDMQQVNSGLEQDWARIRPVLDEALEGLPPADRDVLLLRFFEERSLREVGAAVGLTEDAARMRVVRALDKLRDFLLARGISTAGEVVSAALTTYGAQAAPPSLAAFVTTSALAASAPVSGTAIALLTMSNAKLAAIGIIIATGIMMPALWQHRLNSRLQGENRALRSEVTALHGSYEEARQQMDALGANSDRLLKQEQELAKLRSALHQARQQLELARRGDAPSAEPQQNPKDKESDPPAPAVTEADIAAFLQRPKVEQGDVLGHLRRQMMGQEKRSDGQFDRNRALADAIRPRLEELESHPEQFAEFQSSFVKASIGLQDDEKIAQIQQIVQQTYQQAVAEKLDANSRPQEGVDAWALRRDALDRQATQAVQQLLTTEERGRFDGAFLGIMGIDLGLTDGGWHRFRAPDGTIVFPSQAQGAKP
jgi:RNA polymerase sigma factor (sigma-70 family)